MSDREKGSNRGGGHGRESAPGQQQQVKIVNPSTGETKKIAKSEWNRDLREAGWQRLDDTGTDTPPAAQEPSPAEETPVASEPEPVEGSQPANEFFGQE